MLDEMVNCIEKLKTRIENHTESLQANEWRTRPQLIDPLLYVLGWDVSNPAVVTPEYDIAGDAVDYALLCPEGKPVAVIEAKKLGTSLADKKIQKQIVGYAGLGPTQRVGLTDGDNWEVYDFSRPGELKEKQILDLSIVSDPPQVSAINLLLLWRPILSGNFLAKLASPFEQVEMSINGDPQSSDLPIQRNWVSFTKYNSLPQPPLPKSIKFWDGEERPVHYWYELIYLTAEKLYKEGDLQVDDTPIKLTDYPDDPRSFRYSIHTEPKHSNGDDFTSPKTLGHLPLYLESADNQGAHRRKTVKILEMYGKDLSKVFVMPGE